MKKIFSLLLFLSTICPTFGQTTSDCHKEGGMFISEMANYGHGEYVEFTVYGSSSNPTAPVNLEGWIIDDNNNPKPEVGNEPGHIRLGDEFSAVAPGTLIVICSNKAKPNEIAGFSPFVRNKDYILTFGRGLIGVDNCPDYSTKKVKITNPNYNCGSTRAFSDFKDYAALDNSHDAIQVRNKEGELIHALYWTDEYQEAGNPKAVDIRPIMPNNKDYLGHTTVNFVNDKDWYSVNSFKCEIGGKGSPGEPNYNSYHGNLIKNLKSGAFSSSLKASVTVKQQPSSKNNDGVLEVVIDGGTPVFSVLIQDASSKGFYLQKEFSQKGTHELRNIPAGTMKVFIEDGEGCGLILDITLEKTDALCSGKCKEIGTDASKYCKYEWIAHKDIKDTKQSKITVCPTETTTYTLQVIDNDGNKKNINYTVEIKTADVALRTVLLCAGQSKVLTVKGTDPVWSTGEKGTEITVTKTGTYTVTVTDDEGCLIKGTIEVLNGANPDNIKKYFRALGFYENEADIRPQPPTLIGDNVGAKPAGGGCAVTDLTKHSSVFLGDDEVKLRQEFERLCAEKLTTAEQFYITENQTVCENYLAFEQAEKDFLSDKKTYWSHKFLNGSQKCLFVNVNYEDKFFLNESEVDLKSEIANMTPVDNFYLYSDRGEAIGEFSSFQYGIPAGIYFIDHKQAYKSKYLQYYKWLYPYTSFTETVDLVFYIDRKLAEDLKKMHIYTSNVHPYNERGGLCYVGSNKKLKIDECNGCTAKNDGMSGVFNPSYYKVYNSKEVEYFVASWHSHPDKRYTEPTGPVNPLSFADPITYVSNCNDPSGIGIAGQQLPKYSADIGAIKSQIIPNQFCLDDISKHIPIHKLAGGIGIIAGNKGITIYRMVHDHIYESTKKLGQYYSCVTLPINGKYYPRFGNQGYPKFQEKEKIYVINYNLNVITYIFNLVP